MQQNRNTHFPWKCLCIVWFSSLAFVLARLENLVNFIFEKQRRSLCLKLFFWCKTRLKLTPAIFCLEILVSLSTRVKTSFGIFPAHSAIFLKATYFVYCYLPKIKVQKKLHSIYVHFSFFVSFFNYSYFSHLISRR